MKAKTLLMLVLSIMISALAANAQGSDKGGKAQIDFEQKLHDFGAIAEDGGLATCEFKFINAGDAPLVIISATATCGCTQPSYPKQAIKPGKEGVIKVSYNPKGRPGAFDKQVTVRTNSKKNAKTTLRIIGVVKPSK